MTSYHSTVLSNWDRFVSLIHHTNTTTEFVITGNDLDLASIVAISRYSKAIRIAEEAIPLIEQSAKDVQTRLAEGATIYAVNTGVGGSAKTRTNKLERLQQAIIRTLNNGIINDRSSKDLFNDASDQVLLYTQMLDEEDSTTMPQHWVKAALLIRCNTLVRGNSGVRMELLNGVLKMIQKNVIPEIPLRGSISASGDLSPLSYLAGAISGNPGINVWLDGTDGSRKSIKADVGMLEADIPIFSFAPKEGIALVNGTSVSAGIAALVIQDVHHCVVLAQLLTAMSVEALNGTIENFDPYLSEVRNHPGQTEASHVILKYLRGSKLARGPGTENSDSLRQDRYSIRTTSQWIGPELEGLQLSHRQVVIECNSITDNPLVKPDGSIIQGGNFQANPITAAMDRTRLTLQTIGRMIFQQTTELMNPATNNGLPPNLTSDEPSCDFLMKGLDISSASYMSELAFLSHRVLPSVMVADNGNQSLNSLALISTRYTSTSLSVFMCLASNQLLALCQALDLRAIQLGFFDEIKSKIKDSSSGWMKTWLKDGSLLEDEQAGIWGDFIFEFDQLSSIDYLPRFQATMQAVFAKIMARKYERDGICETYFYKEVKSWVDEIAQEATKTFETTITTHEPSKTIPYLGAGSTRMYRYVREDLRIPFLRNDHSGSASMPMFEGLEAGAMIGTFTTRIYKAFKYGAAMFSIMEGLREALESEM